MAVVVTVAKGYDLGYIWKTRGRPAPGARPAAITSTPRRPGNRPGGGGDREREHSVPHPGRSLSAGPMTPSTSSAIRRPRSKPQAARPLRDVRRSPGPVEGRRALPHWRTGDRAGAGGGAGDPAARRLHRRHGLVLQVDLGAARLDPGKRAPGAAGGRRPGAGLLVRTGGEVPGGLAPGQPGRAGVPAGMGRGHPDRVSRCPGGRAGAGPVRGSGPGRDVVAAGHQPGRRPAGSHSQSDRADHPDRSGWEVAGAGYREPARGPGRAAGCRGDGGGV